MSWVWIIITFFLLHSLKSFFNKARDMLYFKRLIQIPKLPDVREQGVGTDYKLSATHRRSCTELHRQFFLNLYFYLFIFLMTPPDHKTGKLQDWSDTIFSLSLIRAHLTFCMQLHLQNMWSQWWSSLMRTNQSNKMMMTTTRSHSSRLVKPRHPVSRHSHKYGTWLLIAHNPVQYNCDYFMFAANGYIWSDIRTPKWRIWREVSCFPWIWTIQ